jgi:isopenicillin-N epimerase
MAAQAALAPRAHWALDDSIHFLNHGSYGATPTRVLERQAALRARLESEPVRFMEREYEPLLSEVRSRVATFVGAQAEDLAFVTNATTGVNAVVRSLDFRPGDELLTTSHGYAACTNVLHYVAERTGAKVVVAPLPFPTGGATELAEAVLRHVTARTRLVLLDQLTSPTALILPVETLVRELEGRGVPVLVDAAHVPGQLPMQLDAVGASFTTGNLHKWVCAPKGAALLHVRRDRQSQVRPPVISHGARSPRTDKSRFLLEFDWCGTFDPTAVLSVPEALDLLGGLYPGGWPELMRRNRQAALDARTRLLDLLGTPPVCPPALVPAMATVLLPWCGEGVGARLFDEFRVEVPVIPFEGRLLLRVSMQQHVRPEDLDALERALRVLKGRLPVARELV